MPKIIEIAAGDRYTVALTESGQMYTFGKGEDGQLDHGDNADKIARPALIEGFCLRGEDS